MVSGLPLRSAVGSGRPEPVDLGWRETAGGFDLANPLRDVAVGERAADGAGFVQDGVMFAPVTAEAGAEGSRVGSTRPLRQCRP